MQFDYSMREWFLHNNGRRIASPSVATRNSFSSSFAWEEIYSVVFFNCLFSFEMLSEYTWNCSCCSFSWAICSSRACIDSSLYHDWHGFSYSFLRFPLWVTRLCRLGMPCIILGESHSNPFCSKIPLTDSNECFGNENYGFSSSNPILPLSSPKI